MSKKPCTLSKDNLFLRLFTGLNSNKVICHAIRADGDFSGKELRNTVSCITIALAIYDLQLPIRVCYTRAEDMKLTGHRHPVKIINKVGFLNSEKLKSLDIRLYGNGGYSTDPSQIMIERATLHCDNIYKCENMRVRERVCRTNLPRNTAMRGLGCPQDLLASELIMD
ncbi:unnamed protein product [Rotaria sp. Silwood2]|nr:unnamed protein product [Rotaria sp. Silwood2]CAF3077990.1 unnamed protein product [Rotaria sp. Silwood2]CAF3293538.1 unnamed protein product [Rotaria sp. Silwood2]CAF4082277.1 unnamed protein product [Rotaria sp. Silwood2]CAF4312418.1 unnamed protein product [Rotaria sp. Silwood2]